MPDRRYAHEKIKIFDEHGIFVSLFHDKGKLLFSSSRIISNKSQKLPTGSYLFQCFLKS